MLREYTISGAPIAQGRPRAFRRGKFIGFYDPKRSKDWKGDVLQQIKGQSPNLLEGPLSLSLFFKMPAAKTCKPGTPHTKRPDLDNLVKAIKDALNGILWHDDCQITSLHARKVYSTDPQACGVIIRVGHDENHK